MNGRRARLIRRYAEVVATKADGYAPRTIRTRTGEVRAVFPEVRLVDGSPRSIARKTRRRWHRTNRA